EASARLGSQPPGTGTGPRGLPVAEPEAISIHKAPTKPQPLRPPMTDEEGNIDLDSEPPLLPTSHVSVPHAQGSGRPATRPRSRPRPHPRLLRRKSPKRHCLAQAPRSSRRTSSISPQVIEKTSEIAGTLVPLDSLLNESRLGMIPPGTTRGEVQGGRACFHGEC